MDQIEQIALQQHASGVAKIILQIGPLSGIEPHLLKQAFSLASGGTLAEHSLLEIKPHPIEVECSECGQRTLAKPNRLVCGGCGNWKTSLISGDEMLLESVELICDEAINYV